MPIRTRSRGAWICAGTSACLLWASFPPLDWGPLGWIALVPLLLVIRPEQRPRGTVIASLVCGFLAQLSLLQWLRYGHATMYMAWLALSVYTSLYFPAFVLLSRTAVHRFRVPFVLAVPTIWVGLEYFRAYLLTGFSWYYLGHTQYRFIELIQISDLFGAYGVSFVVATSAAALAAVLPEALLRRLGLLPQHNLEVEFEIARPVRRAGMAVGFALCLVAATLTYGYVRRAQATFTAGPRVALIQGDFTSEVKHDANEAVAIFNKHYLMTGAAVKFQPDVIVWPETMYRNPLLLKSPDVSDNDLLRLAPLIPAVMWKSSQVPDALFGLSRQAGADMIVGIDTLIAEPGAVKHYNSAVLTTPDTGVVARYDKMHRVIFGEYIPLKEVLPFLRGFVPYGGNFGIEAGDGPKIFKCKNWNLAPLICYEDTVPQLVRGTIEKLNDSANGKRVDCLVNLTNDGWFHGSSRSRPALDHVPVPLRRVPQTDGPRGEHRHLGRHQRRRHGRRAGGLSGLRQQGPHHDARPQVGPLEPPAERGPRRHGSARQSHQFLSAARRLVRRRVRSARRCS